MRIRVLLAAACALCALIAPSALAQQWPGKPVRLVLPFAPGGPVDLVARTVGPRAGERLGQPLIIENRVGAGGNIAADVVLKAPADGYTLLFVTTGLVTNPFFLKGSPEPARFAGVLQLLITPFVLVVSNGFPPKTFPDILAYIRVGLVYALGSPEAFDTKMRNDYARFGRVAKEAGIMPQ